MNVIHVVLNDDGTAGVSEGDTVLLMEWTQNTGQALLVHPVEGMAERRAKVQEVVARKAEEPFVQAVLAVQEEPKPEPKKKDMSAGRESGATIKARAEALCVELGIKKDKPTVACVSEAMTALVEDYERMILGMDAEAERESQKAACWVKLVGFIRTKGQ